MGQMTLPTAHLALDLEVRRTGTGSCLVCNERRMSRAWRIRVAELHPRKLVEVPAWARDDEASRDHCRRFAFGLAVLVDVAREIWAVCVPLELEKARLDRGEQLAAWATKPSREWENRHTRPSPRVKRVLGLLEPGR
jgi:hypothetical protein